VDVGTIRSALYLSLSNNIELHAILLSHWHYNHYAGLYVLRWSQRPLTLVHPPGRDPEIGENPINIRKFVEIRPYEKVVLGSLRDIRGVGCSSEKSPLDIDEYLGSEYRAAIVSSGGLLRPVLLLAQARP